jgi:hypothetical protein
MSVENWFRMMATIVFLSVLGGCASGGMSVAPQSRYIEERSEPVPIQAQAEDATLRVTVETVIAPNGPASWLKDADWDEYILTIENLSTERVTIDSSHLIDPRGVYVSSERSMQMLEHRAKTLETEYESYGIAYTKHLGRAGAVIAANIGGTGILTTGLLGAGAAAAAPLVAVAIPAYVYWHYHTRNTSNDKITAEFAGRLAPQPLMLAPGAKTSASIFFPPVPSPKAVVLGYRHGRGDGSLEVSVAEQLAGLHERESGQ